MNENTELSVRDFVRLTGVSYTTLKYYDIEGVFKAKRSATMRRYYSPHQVILLNMVSVLAAIGISLSTIKGLIVSRSPNRILELLKERERELDKKLMELQTMYSIIHTYRENISEGVIARDNEISVVDLPETPIILGHETRFEDTESFYEEFGSFISSAKERHINLRYPIGGLHYNVKSFMAAPGRPDRFFSLDPRGNEVMPAGKYLVAYKRGYYGEHGDLPKRIACYARKNGLEFDGKVYVVYVLDEISVMQQDQYLARCCIGIKHK